MSLDTNNRVLITGASGFIGTNLSQHLAAKGYQVSPLSLRRPDWDKHIDPNTGCYIHLAGKAHDLKNISDEQAYFDINTKLTILLFEHFLQSNASTFIYFSSVKAVADEVVGELTEDVNPNPKTAYGKSKLEAEKYLLAQNIPSDKRIIIMRPCMVHGPGNKGNLNLLYKFVSKGLPYPLASFQNARSFLGIDNLCFIVEEVIRRHEVKSGVYNLADDGSLSTKELIKIISECLGKKPVLWSIPKSIIKSAAKLGDLLKLPLNSHRLQKLTEDYLVSNGKIKSALGIELMPTSIEDGLRKTIRSFSK